MKYFPMLVNSSRQFPLCVIAVLCATVLATTGCNRDLSGGGSASQAIKLTSDYQAVHLDNGQVLFGKLEQAGSEYPVLHDVFAAQNQVNPTTKEVSRTLTRRNVELHNPDYMVVNARHIVAIEPVAPNSRVAEVIKQANAQPVAAPHNQ
jgi:hypothetical protein